MKIAIKSLYDGKEEVEIIEKETIEECLSYAALDYIFGTVWHHIDGTTTKWEEPITVKENKEKAKSEVKTEVKSKSKAKNTKKG